VGILYFLLVDAGSTKGAFQIVAPMVKAEGEQGVRCKDLNGTCHGGELFQDDMSTEYVDGIWFR